MVQHLVVLSAVPPPSPLKSEASNNPQQHHLDQLDEFNHPRQRRDSILAALQQQQSVPDVEFVVVVNPGDHDDTSSLLHNVYAGVHSAGLLSFLETAWSQWRDLGEAGRDPLGFHPSTTSAVASSNEVEETNIPQLVPPCTPLLRTSPQFPQRPSQHVLGQVGYYCTDTCTPIFRELRSELRADAQLVATTRQQLADNNNSCCYYLLPHHPGHHAARDCFGGYCYLNHVAALAHTVSHRKNQRVAILDLDYHCGNGTAAIFADDDAVLVLSLHCDPDCDYPFHCGWAEDSTATTRYLPLPPGTGWHTGYHAALQQALQCIRDFGPDGALLISLGLDTYTDDPCAIRRAGFHLQGDDYVAMGQCLAEHAPPGIPVVFVQEGGYRMDTIGQAAADVVGTFCRQRV